MRNILVAILLILGCGLPLRGQTDRATLSGTVSDNSDSLIATARITVRSVATGLEYDATTNSAASISSTHCRSVNTLQPSLLTASGSSNLSHSHCRWANVAC